MYSTKRPEHYKRLAEAIRAERKFLGLSQLRMVEMLGGNISYISYRALELGQYSRISAATERNALFVCEELGIDFETCQPMNRAPEATLKKLQAQKKAPRTEPVKTNPHLQLKRVKLLYEVLGDEIKRLEDLLETKTQPPTDSKPKVVELEL